jgi:uncharacterized protein (TIGR00303 family)
MFPSLSSTPPRELPVLYRHAPVAGHELMKLLYGKRPLFVCVIASTDTALVPGISAAGAGPELIPYTAAADAEVLIHGSARCIPGVPCNPLGPPGPAIITRAALELAGIPTAIVDAGCRVKPDAPTIDLGGEPGGMLGEADGVLAPEALFERGRDLGRELAAQHDYLLLGESVPGGTTTALALLLAFGIAAGGRVSSSLAANAHGLKTAIAARALARLDRADAERDPLQAVQTLGDPMQPVAAGIAAGALACGTPVLLAGGTQMIAVVALLRRLAARGRCIDPTGLLGVATTRWVVDDPTADAAGLMRDLGDDPLLATPLSFADSRHEALRRYEDYLVKEGVGAGGAVVAAALAADISCAQIMQRVEAIYEEMFLERP